MKLLPFYESDIDHYSEQINVSNVNSEGQTDAQALPKSVKTMVYNELSGKGLKFVQLNIVSLTKHIDEIRTILCCNDIHVLTLNETRLDNSIYVSKIEIPHCNIVRKDRNMSGGGGVTLCT